MIKDTQQKLKAIRYCVAAGYVPHMEVVVQYAADVADVGADISDLDVLGVQPAGTADAKRVLFDCKTQAKISPINRALWAAGISQLVQAEQAFVILTKAAPEGHRLAANELKVRLFSEALFEKFCRTASAAYGDGTTYLDAPEAWEQLFGMPAKQPQLAPLLNFVRNQAPLEANSSAGFRALLSRLKHAEGELDVAKPAHRMLYGIVLSQALVFLAGIARDFSPVFDQDMGRPEFEAVLRNHLWGGRESYQLRQRLHVAVVASKGGEEPAALQLPGWDRLVELIRGFLDAPHLAGTAALPIKDMAFREVLPARELANKRIQDELRANNRARQFALSANRYLGSLSRLLKDCSEHYATQLKEA